MTRLKDLREMPVQLRAGERRANPMPTSRPQVSNRRHPSDHLERRPQLVASKTHRLHEPHDTKRRLRECHGAAANGQLAAVEPEPGRFIIIVVATQ